MGHHLIIKAVVFFAASYTFYYKEEQMTVDCKGLRPLISMFPLMKIKSQFSDEINSEKNEF